MKLNKKFVKTFKLKRESSKQVNFAKLLVWLVVMLVAHALGMEACIIGSTHKIISRTTMPCFFSCNVNEKTCISSNQAIISIIYECIAKFTRKYFFPTRLFISIHCKYTRPACEKQFIPPTVYWLVYWCGVG